MAPSLLDLLHGLHRDAERVRQEVEEERRRNRGLPKQSRGVPEPGLREHHVALDSVDPLADPGLYA